MPKNILDCYPLQNHENWYHDHFNRVVIITKDKPNVVQKLVGKFLARSLVRDVTFDTVVSKVWDLCDGQHTLYSIANALYAEFNDKLWTDSIKTDEQREKFINLQDKEKYEDICKRIVLTINYFLKNNWIILNQNENTLPIPKQTY